MKGLSSLLVLCLCAAAGLDSRGADGATRLAIAEFAITPEMEFLQPDGEALLDLVTSRLSGEGQFELVERAALAKVFKENSLSLAGAVKPEIATRVGTLLRADWLLLPSFQRFGSTNHVFAKIVDAHTGAVRDLASIPLQRSNLLATAEALAAFAVGSRNTVQNVGDRLFLAFGAFEDLGLNRRYPNFGEQLRAAMSQRYQRTRICVVERSQVTALLNELRMELGGLIQKSPNTASVQPAVVIVDGFYQSFRTNRVS